MNQRTTFFGRKPAQTPRKDGENRPVHDRRRAAVKAGEIAIRFNNDTATQFGGYPLWHAFATDVGLNAKLSQHLKLPRGENGFTAVEAARFLVDAKVLGCARLMHVETLRLDPALARCSGIDGLPSGVTLGRILKEHTGEHVAALDRLNVRFNHELWRKHHRRKGTKPGPRPVGLDYDSSTFAVYGKQEQADRGRSFRKKDAPGFQPRFAFLAGLGVMIHQQLLPQSHNLSKDFLAFHREAVERLPKGARLAFVRGDGGIYSNKTIRAFERDRLAYAVSASLTSHLRARIAEIPEEAWEEGEDERGRPYSIARIRYRPRTWDRERMYIISRRLRDKSGQRYFEEGLRYRHFAYVTNRRATPVEQFRFCVERCSLESFIKEAKLGAHYDRLPSAQATANRAYLQYTALAYNLAIYWKLHRAPRAVNRWTLDTLRARLFRIGGNLRRRGGRWVLSLPRWWPYRSVLEEIKRTTLTLAHAPP